MGGIALVEHTLKKKQRLMKGATFVGNVIFILLLLIMLLLNYFMLQSYFANGVPTIAGHHLYIVLSGSMSPTINTGSMVVVRPQAADEITVGDIITYRQPGKSTLTIHRVVEVRGEGGLQFITQGDANETIDIEPVLAKNVMGKVVMAIPFMGYVIDFAQTIKGLVSLFIIPGLLIIFYEMRNLIRYAGEWDKLNRMAKGSNLEVKD
jgi:signal peptidase